MENNKKCKSSYISYDDIVSRNDFDKKKSIKESLLNCPIVQAEISRRSLSSSNDIDNLIYDDLYKQIENTRLEDWLDNQDVARMLHMSYRTLQNLRTDGTLPYSRINGKIYYRRQDIQKLMADNFHNA